MTDQDSPSPDRLQDLLDEVGVTSDPGLLRVLGEISALGTGSAPEASDDLSAVLSADAAAPGRWGKRRITFLGGALAVSMGVGMSAVAADTFHLSAGGGSGIDSVALPAAGARVDRARADSLDQDHAARAPGTLAGPSRDALVDRAGQVPGGTARSATRSADADVEKSPPVDAEIGATEQQRAPLARPQTPMVPSTAPSSTPWSLPAAPPERDGGTGSSGTVPPGPGSALDAGVQAHDTGVVVASGPPPIPAPVDRSEITPPGGTAAAADGSASADRVHGVRRAAGRAPASPGSLDPAARSGSATAAASSSSADPAESEIQVARGSFGAASAGIASWQSKTALGQDEMFSSWMLAELYDRVGSDVPDGMLLFTAHGPEDVPWSVFLSVDFDVEFSGAEFDARFDVEPASAAPEQASDAPGSGSPTPHGAGAIADLPPDAARVTPMPVEGAPGATTAFVEESPGVSEPGTGTPEPTEPGLTEPGPMEPGPTEPGPMEPGPMEPGPMEPGPMEPGPIQVDPGPPLDPPRPTAEDTSPAATLEVAPTLEEPQDRDSRPVDAPSEEPRAPGAEPTVGGD
ncbi:hypothetical protein E8P82_11060 [Arthrobacter echini]|uniref:Uncharacterized protein n=1 Tax=Arthrobacter echini TaxID=1529066 RepID=A0A4S5E329_9MICC|nr:hypothetical protein [Arthrobacter echini]THJ65816.1 hypothetical protein E8P82_11060 [Arthrobacter echini]